LEAGRIFAEEVARCWSCNRNNLVIGRDEAKIISIEENRFVRLIKLSQRTEMRWSQYVARVIRELSSLVATPTSGEQRQKFPQRIVTKHPILNLQMVFKKNITTVQEMVCMKTNM
jgi:hypothetical protein